MTRGHHTWWSCNSYYISYILIRALYRIGYVVSSSALMPKPTSVSKQSHLASIIVACFWFFQVSNLHQGTAERVHCVPQYFPHQSHHERDEDSYGYQKRRRNTKWCSGDDNSTSTSDSHTKQCSRKKRGRKKTDKKKRKHKHKHQDCDDKQGQECNKKKSSKKTLPSKPEWMEGDL